MSNFQKAFKVLKLRHQIKFPGMGDGQCDEIWRNFATLRQNFKSLDPFFQGLFSILSSVEPTLEKLGEFPLLQMAKY